MPFGNGLGFGHQQIVGTPVSGVNFGTGNGVQTAFTLPGYASVSERSACKLDATRSR